MVKNYKDKHILKEVIDVQIWLLPEKVLLERPSEFNSICELIASVYT